MESTGEELILMLVAGISQFPKVKSLSFLNLCCGKKLLYKIRVKI